MSPEPPMTFPPELLELFIDNIPQDSETGWDTLCSCLLVSRVFFQRSRSRLFAHVTIFSDDKRRMTGLRNLLDNDAEDQGYPKLTPCIKSLEIIIVSVHHDLGDSSNFAAILSSLGSAGALRKFRLEAMYRMDFSDTSAGTRRAIHTICHSSSLEELEIAKINNVPSSLFNIWGLEKLSITKTTILLEDDDIDAGLPMVQPRLNTFDYRFHLALPKTWLCQPSPFSGLCHFTVKFHARGLGSTIGADLGILLNIASQTLQSLDIRTQDAQVIFPHYLPPLRDLSALRQLRISVAGTRHYRPTGAYLTLFDGASNAVQILQTIERAPPSLSRITIFIYVIMGHVVEVGFRNESDWQNLGNVLVDGRFNSVEKVEVVVIAEVDPSSRNVHYPFLEDFPLVWASRHPGIPFTVRRTEEYREDLFL